MERIRIINLFRLGKRLEKNDNNKDLYQKFEKQFYELWDSLTKQEKSSLEGIHERLKDKYSDSFTNDKKKSL